MSRPSRPRVVRCRAEGLVMKVVKDELQEGPPRERRVLRWRLDFLSVQSSERAPWRVVFEGVDGSLLSKRLWMSI
jgi:hypothetical protein